MTLHDLHDLMTWTLAWIF